MGLRLMAVAILATLTMMVKYAVGAGIAFPEVLFWRQALTVPILLGWLAAHGQTRRLATNRLPIHFRRTILGTIGMFLNFGAPVLLPLAEATVLGFTTPLFAVILSAMVLRERVGKTRWTAVFLGFVGVVVIAGPGASHIASIGTAVGLSAGLMVAIISIQVRDLTRTEDPVTIVFWFAALSTPFLALLLPFYAEGHDLKQWLILALIGILGCAGQILLTAALRFGQVSSVIVMDYSALAWSTVYGFLIWHDVPGLTTMLGAPLIIGAGAIIAWREHKLHRRAVPASSAAVD
jgi:drug/metabolite transporter (DMT)-like permease